MKALTLSETVLCGGRAVIGVVSLTAKAPAGGTLVSLVGDTNEVTVPASVTVPAGRTAAPFTVQTHPVSDTHSVSIRSLLGETRTVVLTLRPPGPASFSLTPETVTGGANCIGTIVWEAPSVRPDTIEMHCDLPTVTLRPIHLLLPVDERNLQFEVETERVTRRMVAHITMTHNHQSRTLALIILPVGRAVARRSSTP